MIYKIRKYLAVLFLSLISLFIVPKEYIHELSGHEDTLCFSHHNNILEKSHHHCSILNFNAPQFVTAISCHLLADNVQLHIFFIDDYNFNYQDLTNLSSLRAPPYSA